MPYSKMFIATAAILAPAMAVSTSSELTDTIVFKVAPTSLDPTTAAKAVALGAGLASPRRTFRPAGRHEEAHVEAELHLWYESEPIGSHRQISMEHQSELYQTGNENQTFTHAQVSAAEAALARMRIMDATMDGRSLAATDDDTRVAVMAAKIRPKAQPDAPSNDPLYSRQGGLSSIGITSAWDLHAGSPSVVVAVVDTGMDMDHPDLNNRWVNQGETCGDGKDNDNNGYVDDCYGYNFADAMGNLALEGRGSHGTHCAGIVAANSDNGVGVAGTAGGKDGAAGVSLMTLTTFGKRATRGFAEAIIYAADNGATISSNSWGYTRPGAYDPAVLAAIDYFNAKASGSIKDGGMVIFAAGNDASSHDHYPAFYSGAYAVAAVDNGHRPASFTNKGSWVDISAPGVSVYSTVINSYDYMSGTSMACPMVAGVFALLASIKPGLTKAEYVNCLESTATDVSSSSASNYGAGVISPAAALRCVSGSSSPPPSCWTYKEGYYVKEGHGSCNHGSSDDLETAQDMCKKDAQCSAIAKQSNLCGGKYRVVRGGPTFVYYSNWQPYNLWSYGLDRSCLPSSPPVLPPSPASPSPPAPPDLFGMIKYLTTSLAAQQVGLDSLKSTVTSIKELAGMVPPSSPPS